MDRAAGARDARLVTWWTFAALLACQGAGVPWAAPVAAAAPWILHVRAREGAAPAPVSWRWVATVFLTGLAMAGLGGERALRAVPAGAWVVNATRAWLDGTAGAFPSPALLAASVAACAAAAIPARGIAGAVVMAQLLLGAAVSAAAVYSRAFNLVEATVVAVAPWTLGAIAGCVLLMPALRARGETKARRMVLAGAIVVAAALLLRLAAAPVFTRIARELTLP